MLEILVRMREIIFNVDSLFNEVKRINLKKIIIIGLGISYYLGV